MRLKLMANVAGLVAAMSLPVAGFAATQPTAESQVWNLPNEASSLLSQLHKNACRVRNLADQLQMYDRERGATDGVGWQADADLLETMRNRINKMDQMTYRLRVMGSKLPQAQRHEISKMEPAMLELTDTAQTAIEFLDNNENHLGFAPYPSYAGELYAEARRVEHATNPSTANAGAQLKPTATTNLDSGL